MDAFIQNIETILVLLEKSNLDASEKYLFKQFVEAYKILNDEYTKNPTPESKVLIDQMNRPLNVVFSNKNSHESEGAQIINEGLASYSSSLEKGFARVLKNNESYYPTFSQSDEQGFIKISILITIVLFLGIILGFILFKIK